MIKDGNVQCSGKSEGLMQEYSESIRWLIERRKEYQFVDLSKRNFPKGMEKQFLILFPDEYMTPKGKYFTKKRVCLA